ncbi:P-loop containing nucleoside triphosphate hydrolase protein [Aspergillus varians]
MEDPSSNILPAVIRSLAGPTYGGIHGTKARRILFDTSRIITISGWLERLSPSHDRCVGKGTLVQKLFDEYPNTFAFAVSHTTRKPRVGEVEGKNYFFGTPSTFGDLISQDAFVEHATAIADQMTKRLVVVLDIEMNGVKQMKANLSIDARYTFTKPPSLKALERRLQGRGTERDEDIQKRLQQAKAEVKYADTQSVHDKAIVNNDLERAFKQLKEFTYG